MSAVQMITALYIQYTYILVHDYVGDTCLAHVPSSWVKELQEQILYASVPRDAGPNVCGDMHTRCYVPLRAPADAQSESPVVQ